MEHLPSSSDLHIPPAPLRPPPDETAQVKPIWAITAPQWGSSLITPRASPQLGLVYAPLTLLLARFAVGPQLSTWTLIWFNVIFEVLLAPAVTCFGLLGFAMEYKCAARPIAL